MFARSRVRRVAAAVTILVMSVTGFAPLGAAPGDDILQGYTFRTAPLSLDEWQDPAALFELGADELAPEPEFDFSTLHDSTVFATGVDWLLVENDPLPEARSRHLRVLQVIDTLERDVTRSGRRLVELRPRVDSLNIAISYERGEEERLEQEIDLIKAAIAEFAVRAFIGEEELTTALAAPDSALSETRVVVNEVRDGQFADIDARELELARRRDRRARLESDRRSLRREISEVRRHRLLRLDQMRTAETMAERTAAGYQAILHDRLTAEVAGTNVPLVTLNAYVIAARVLAEERPSCGLEWWMLAGVGQIESEHGTIDGTELDVNGTPDDGITGPALDGRILSGAEFLEPGQAAPPPTDRTAATSLATEPTADGTEAADGEPAAPVIKRLALIRDTDGGRLDGDRTYDRAVGPMQFIPQTWRKYEVDANHDGVADPQNIYDAAVASARYLCAASSMWDEEGRKRAYFAYNHDEEYTENVLAASDRLRRLIRVPEPTEAPTDWLGIFEAEDTIESALRRIESDLTTFDLPEWNAGS